MSTRDEKNNGAQRPMKGLAIKGYRTSADYTKLKELLDNGYTVVLVYIHDASRRLFSDIAKRISHIPGGVDGDWYSLGCWSYFPTVDKMNFEDYCKSNGFSFILPEEE